jgi:Amt family ammonium transporter
MSKASSPLTALLWAIGAMTLTTLSTVPAFAQTAAAAPKVDAADTAWMLGATGLVLMMTIPGLALFYAGMVRKKNILATMAQCMAATFLVSVLWAFFGYSLSFTGDGPYIGTLDRLFLNGMTLESI